MLGWIWELVGNGRHLARARRWHGGLEEGWNGTQYTLFYLLGHTLNETSFLTSAHPEHYLVEYRGRSSHPRQIDRYIDSWGVRTPVLNIHLEKTDSCITDEKSNTSSSQQLTTTPSDTALTTSGGYSVAKSKTKFPPNVAVISGFSSIEQS
jgi:hypothetical protein